MTGGARDRAGSRKPPRRDGRVPAFGPTTRSKRLLTGSPPSERGTVNEISGAVAGRVVQARAISGDVHIQHTHKVAAARARWQAARRILEDIEVSIRLRRAGVPYHHEDFDAPIVNVDSTWRYRRGRFWRPEGAHSDIWHPESAHLLLSLAGLAR